MTACWISVNRQGQPEAQHADRFLKFVNEERVLQLAMAADAGDESIQLTRFLDTEAYDIAELPMQLYLFFNKLNALFIDGRCVETGYTSHSLKIMKRAGGYFIEGVPYTLGGAGKVTPAIIQACLSRLQCFVRLALNVVNAEFPGYNIIMSFCIFDLGSQSKKRKNADEEHAVFVKQFGTYLVLVDIEPI